ncbi:hypothetical protein [Spiroplasma alleghenense]|uniref:Uncharacterized protein n=1 Tax=Spiroplasma alleghenense TaxID=216931 RepID=A0A345Z4Y6_9MOLU|nr:hypothetical protein [Spiroplasma alleghenense]AXK51665.1 hypothetical protein SALLE_v1c09950 [Spiroplasma alleghenense]
MEIARKSQDYKNKINEEGKKQRILIKGEFGSGKTTSINEFLDNKKKILRVDANILANSDNVAETVLKTCFPKWAVWGWSKGPFFVSIISVLNFAVALIATISVFFINFIEKVELVYISIPIGISIALFIITLIWKLFYLNDMNVLSKKIRKCMWVVVDDLNRISSLDKKKEIYNLFERLLNKNKKTVLIMIDSSECDLLSIDFESKNFDKVFLKKPSQEDVLKKINSSIILSENIDYEFVERVKKSDKFREIEKFIALFDNLDKVDKNKIIEKFFKIKNIIAISYLYHFEKGLYSKILEQFEHKPKIYNDELLFELDKKFINENNSSDINNLFYVSRNPIIDKYRGVLFKEEFKFIWSESNKMGDFVFSCEEDLEFIFEFILNPKTLVEKIETYDLENCFQLFFEKDSFKYSYSGLLNFEKLFKRWITLNETKISSEFYSKQIFESDWKLFYESTTKRQAHEIKEFLLGKIGFKNYRHKHDFINNFNNMWSSLFFEGDYFLKKDFNIDDFFELMKNFEIIREHWNNEDIEVLGNYSKKGINLIKIDGDIFKDHNNKIIMSNLIRENKEQNINKFIKFFLKIEGFNFIADFFHRIMMEGDVVSEDETKWLVNLLKKDFILIHENIYYQIKQTEAINYIYDEKSSLNPRMNGKGNQVILNDDWSNMLPKLITIFEES